MYPTLISMKLQHLLINREKTRTQLMVSQQFPILTFFYLNWPPFQSSSPLKVSFDHISLKACLRFQFLVFSNGHPDAIFFARPKLISQALYIPKYIFLFSAWGPFCTNSHRSYYSYKIIPCNFRCISMILVHVLTTL